MSTQAAERQEPPKPTGGDPVTRDALDASIAKLEAAIAQLELRLAERIDEKIDRLDRKLEAGRRHTVGATVAAAVMSAVVAPVGTLAS